MHEDKRGTAENEERARREMAELEEDPPERLEDWPTDRAKYLTFGGPDGDHGYEEGPERQLGPSDLRYHEDGSITIGGKPVDDPDRYRSDPIPGGPTDPDAPHDPGAPVEHPPSPSGGAPRGGEIDDTTGDDA